MHLAISWKLCAICATQPEQLMIQIKNSLDLIGSAVGHGLARLSVQAVGWITSWMNVNGLRLGGLSQPLVKPLTQLMLPHFIVDITCLAAERKVKLNFRPHP